MEAVWIGYLDKALQMEENGYIDEALALLGKLYVSFPQVEAEILLEKGKMEFRNGDAKAALFDMIKSYESSGAEEVFELIMEAYYLPNKDMLMETYRDNIRLLEGYVHYRNSELDTALNVLPIWQDENILVYADEVSKCFGTHKRQSCVTNIKKGTILITADECWAEDILSYEANAEGEQALPFEDAKDPLYIAYEQPYWALMIQLNSFKELISKNRIVFLVGKDSINQYFSEDMVLFPEAYTDRAREKYLDMITGKISEIVKETEQLQEENEKYYEVQGKYFRKEIEQGSIRVLVWTTRFSTAMQYHARDCMNAMRNLGYAVDMLIESDNLRRTRKMDVIQKIYTLKPNIIFKINHFRDDDMAIPKQAVVLTWIQDKLPQSTGNQEKINKLEDRDILMSMFISDLSGSQWGMRYKDVLKAPISANTDIYREYELTEEEKEKYACDICIVANGTDYKGWIEQSFGELPTELYDSCKAVIDVYIDLMEQEIFFYGLEENYEIIRYIVQTMEIAWDEIAIKSLADKIYYFIFYRRYKTLVAEWLIENGYTNIKLYGNEWDKSEKCRAYAQGMIKNGECLSKALNAAKISIGLHPHVSLPAKLIESVASNTLYLAHDIPSQFDIANAREYFVEGEELIYYYSKQDLLDKIAYYLGHEEERRKVIAAGRKRIYEDLTYEAMLERIMRELAELLKKRGM